MSKRPRSFLQTARGFLSGFVEGLTRESTALREKRRIELTDDDTTNERAFKRLKTDKAPLYNDNLGITRDSIASNTLHPNQTLSDQGQAEDELRLKRLEGELALLRAEMRKKAKVAKEPGSGNRISASDTSSRINTSRQNSCQSPSRQYDTRSHSLHQSKNSALLAPTKQTKASFGETGGSNDTQNMQELLASAKSKLKPTSLLNGAAVNSAPKFNSSIKGSSTLPGISSMETFLQEIKTAKLKRVAKDPLAKRSRQESEGPGSLFPKLLRRSSKNQSETPSERLKLSISEPTFAITSTQFTFTPASRHVIVRDSTPSNVGSTPSSGSSPTTTQISTGQAITNEGPTDSSELTVVGRQPITKDAYRFSSQRDNWQIEEILQVPARTSSLPTNARPSHSSPTKSSCIETKIQPKTLSSPLIATKSPFPPPAAPLPPLPPTMAPMTEIRLRVSPFAMRKRSSEMLLDYNEKPHTPANRKKQRLLTRTPLQPEPQARRMAVKQESHSPLIPQTDLSINTEEVWPRTGWI